MSIQHTAEKDALAAALFHLRHPECEWSQTNDWWRNKMLGQAKSLVEAGWTRVIPPAVTEPGDER